MSQNRVVHDFCNKLVLFKFWSQLTTITTCHDASFDVGVPSQTDLVRAEYYFKVDMSNNRFFWRLYFPTWILNIFKTRIEYQHVIHKHKAAVYQSVHVNITATFFEDISEKERALWISLIWGMGIYMESLGFYGELILNLEIEDIIKNDRLNQYFYHICQ